MNQPEKKLKQQMAKECMSCKKAKGKKNRLMDRNTVFSMVNHRPNTKLHFNVTTKEHKADLRKLTSQEWADILPCLKDGINKIENYYKRRGKPGPLGYHISSPAGELSGENQPPHFYMRIVPKYKKNWGVISNKVNYLPGATSNFEKKLRETFQPNQDGVVAEKNKTIARMKNGLIFLSISAKNHLPNDINAIDPETWNEIGETLQELMTKAESKNAFHSFTLRFKIGEKAVKVFDEESYVTNNFTDGSSLQVDLLPIDEENKAKRMWLPEECEKAREGEDEIIARFEQEKIAFKLNNPEDYDKIWNKKNTPSVRGHEEETNSSSRTLPTENQRESIWKQPSTYLIFASGVGICLLGLGIYWLFSKKNKAKSK